MANPAVGFDSSLLQREITVPTQSDAPDTSALTGSPLLKALLGVSVKTQDYDSFKSSYLLEMPLAVRDAGGVPKKRIYKAAHLTKQLASKAPNAIRKLLSSLSDRIDRVDVYCFYSRRDFISVYGSARGERLTPNEFVELTQNAFPHVCVWQYLDAYKSDSKDDRLMVDHFKGKITPAWETIEKSGSPLYVYYSGAECNPLISTADLTLRLVETYQVGTIGGESLLKPIQDLVPKLTAKLRFHNLGGPGYCIKAAAPYLPLDLDETPFIRHPLYFFAWNPGQSRDLVKPTFEWSPVYNAAMELACSTDGNVKFLEFEKDHLSWDLSKDVIIAWTPQDVQNLNSLKDMEHQLPKVMTKDELLAAKSKGK